MSNRHPIHSQWKGKTFILYSELQAKIRVIPTISEISENSHTFCCCSWYPSAIASMLCDPGASRAWKYPPSVVKTRTPPFSTIIAPTMGLPLLSFAIPRTPLCTYKKRNKLKRHFIPRGLQS